jgi:hypothetical protein
VAESLELSLLASPTNPLVVFGQACFSMHFAADYILSFVPPHVYIYTIYHLNIGQAACSIGSRLTKYIRYFFVALCGLIPSFVPISLRIELLQSLTNNLYFSSIIFYFPSIHRSTSPTFAMKTTYAILASIAAQQVAATWSISGQPFKSPQYANNECSDKQKGGFDWSDLKDGDSNFQYGDFDFSKNWKCSNSVGKRDALTKRTFGGKAIKNKCSKAQPASFGCDKRKDGFSITTIDVSVEFDVEIDLHYTMNDGSSCKQKSVPCKKDGSTIENTQCGGAKTVDVYLGSNYKGSKSECEIGLHHIGFDCNPGKPYTPPAPPSPPQAPPSSKPAVSKPVTTSTPAKSSAAPSSSTVSAPCEGAACKPQSSPAASSPPASSSCNGGYGEGCPPVQTPPVHFSSQPPYANSSAPLPPTMKTTKVTPPSEHSSTATPVGESSTIVAPPPAKESSASSCNGAYGESCQASSAMPSPPASTPDASKPSPPSSSASTPAPGMSSSSPQPSSPSYPPPTVGEVLPTCMNTWLQISTEDCKDNTATDCYCKNPKFTKNVIDCVQARCDTDEQTKKELQYLVGICASYVPQNPGLVTDCPNDTFNNTPATPTGGVRSTGAPVNTPAPSGTPAPSMPVTTIVYGSTSLTVPQVHFTTETPVAGATPTAPVGLVPGVAPPQTPATTTAAPYPIGSTLRPSFLPTGTGAVRPSSPAQFTGAASPFKAEAKHVMLGAALAFFAL